MSSEPEAKSAIDPLTPPTSQALRAAQGRGVRWACPD